VGDAGCRASCHSHGRRFACIRVRKQQQQQQVYLLVMRVATPAVTHTAVGAPAWQYKQQQQQKRCGDQCVCIALCHAGCDSHGRRHGWMLAQETARAAAATGSVATRNVGISSCHTICHPQGSRRLHNRQQQQQVCAPVPQLPLDLSDTREQARLQLHEGGSV
jgi:hypothetical protein